VISTSSLVGLADTGDDYDSFLIQGMVFLTQVAGMRLFGGWDYYNE
jgi:hypothetical protein